MPRRFVVSACLSLARVTVVRKDRSLTEETEYLSETENAKKKKRKKEIKKKSLVGKINIKRMRCRKKTKKVHKKIKALLGILGRREGGAETLFLYLDVSVVIY